MQFVDRGMERASLVPRSFELLMRLIVHVEDEASEIVDEEHHVRHGRFGLG